MKRGRHDSQHRRLIGSSMPLNWEKLSGHDYKLKYQSSRRVISETCVKHNPIEVTQVDSFLIMKHYLMDYIRCSLTFYMVIWRKIIVPEVSMGSSEVWYARH